MNPVAMIVNSFPWKFYNFWMKFIGWNGINLSVKGVVGGIIGGLRNHFNGKAKVHKGLGDTDAIFLIADKLLPYVIIKMTAQEIRPEAKYFFQLISVVYLIDEEKGIIQKPRAVIRGIELGKTHKNILENLVGESAV